MDSIETLKDDLLKGGLAICLPRQNRGWDGGVYTLFLHLHRVCEPPTCFFSSVLKNGWFLLYNKKEKLWMERWGWVC